jgi:hypothetical protein
LLVHLNHGRTTTDENGLTHEALCKTIYSRFDFHDGIDFTIGELKRAVKEYDLVVSGISQGNHTGIHLREKTTKACLKAFILLLSSKDTQPEEPTKGKAWTQASCRCFKSKHFLNGLLPRLSLKPIIP